MMIAEPFKFRHLFKPWLRFRDSESGQFVSRAFAMLHPGTTESIDTRRWRHD